MFRIIASFLVFFSVTSSAFAIEWQAKKWFFGAGGGYSNVAYDNYQSAINLTLAAGMTVPVLVEQHLRVAPMVQLHYSPAVAPEVVGGRGGNILATSLQFYIEHDFKAGDRYLWFGVAPKISVNSVVGQYEWIAASSGLQALAVDNSYTLSAGAALRLVIPINPKFSASIDGQYSPFDGALSSVSAQIQYQF